MKALERITPEEAGISSQQMEKLLCSLMHERTQMNGFMAARDGKVFAECWWKPYHKDMVHSNHSIGKSYTCTAIGIAEQEGLLSLGEKVTDIFEKEIKAAGLHVDPQLEQITIRDILTMTTGMAVHPAMTEQWINDFFQTAMKYRPGTHFMYNSSGSCLLGAIILKKTGFNLKEYLTPRLFNKIGINAERFVWLQFPDGIEAEPASFGTTEDNLRLAMLYCQYGKWQGEQILNENFVKNALSVQINTEYAPEQLDGRCGYGYQLWACSRPGIFRFDGGQGQFGIIYPDRKLVVAIHEGAMMPYGPQVTLEAVYENLTDIIQDEKLAPDEKAYAHFLKFKKELQMPDDSRDCICASNNFNGEYKMVAGELDPWICVAPPGKGDFFKLFRNKNKNIPIEKFSICEENEAILLLFNGEKIVAYKDGKLRLAKIHNVFDQLDDYAATARHINKYTLEITIHWMNAWMITQLRFEQVNDQLRTTTMNLRLNEEDNWLFRHGVAERIMR